MITLVTKTGTIDGKSGPRVMAVTNFHLLSEAALAK
jgi:hypothetical protein